MSPLNSYTPYWQSHNNLLKLHNVPLASAAGFMLAHLPMLLDLCPVMVLSSPPPFNMVHCGHHHNVLTYSEKESQV